MRRQRRKERKGDTKKLLQELMMSLVARILMCGVFFAALPACAAEAVKVEKGKVKVEYKIFDPKHLPDPAPPIEPGEAAVCIYQLGVETSMEYTPLGAGPTKGKLEVKVEKLSVALSMNVIIWLPEGAGEQLKAHEEGHRQIAETFYADADKTAKGIAEKMVGKTYAGEGTDEQAAGRSAVQKVNDLFCERYLQAVSAPCVKAQNAFDRITDHGRKERPSAKEAVGIAIKEARGK
jgi:hypothetical protein